mmetsp:Transcript_22545/g.55809  ORF Transcript_22545/g.55809 Transcript_22545/m.55809 type:complete len:349 (+) Transcript_22545:345-1391(+)
MSSRFESDYLSLYCGRLLSLMELTRPAFQAHGRLDAGHQEKSSRANTQLQLTPLAVLYVQTMVAPLRRLYAWGVPTSEALDCVAQAVKDSAGKGVVEIGAGTGYWTSLLRRRGIPVTAYDLHPCHAPEPNGHHRLLNRGNPPPFTSIARGGAEAVLHADELPDAAHVMLVCWPPREGDPGVRSDVSGMALDALCAFRGTTVVYVGETSEVTSGATAGPAFHDALHTDWVLRRRVLLPHWPGAADSLTVWSRKQTRAVKTSKETIELRDSTHGCASSNIEEVESVTGAAGTRRGFLQDMQSSWEETAVAHMVGRAQRGGPKPRRGLERSALDAVRSRSGMFRRLLLAML